MYLEDRFKEILLKNCKRDSGITKRAKGIYNYLLQHQLHSLLRVYFNKIKNAVNQIDEVVIHVFILRNKLILFLHFLYEVVFADI